MRAKGGAKERPLLSKLENRFYVHASLGLPARNLPYTPIHCSCAFSPDYFVFWRALYHFHFSPFSSIQLRALKATRSKCEEERLLASRAVSLYRARTMPSRGHFFRVRRRNTLLAKHTENPLNNLAWQFTLFIAICATLRCDIIGRLETNCSGKFVLYVREIHGATRGESTSSWW